MILIGNEDLRVRKTVTAIQNNFIDMLIEMPYEKITVKALCERAMINKKTFYNYYATLDELLSEQIDEIATEFLRRIEIYSVPQDLEKVNREFILYAVERGKFFERIVCSEHFRYIGGRLINRLVRQTWNDSPDFRILKRGEQSLLFCFICNVGLELYRQWIVDGKKMPIERIIELSNELLCRGAFGFLSIIGQEQ